MPVSEQRRHGIYIVDMNALAVLGGRGAVIRSVYFLDYQILRLLECSNDDEQSSEKSDRRLQEMHLRGK